MVVNVAVIYRPIAALKVSRIARIPLYSVTQVAQYAKSSMVRFLLRC